MADAEGIKKTVTQIAIEVAVATLLSMSDAKK